MKLIRFGELGKERPGVLIEAPETAPMILDVRGMSFDLEDYNEDFFRRFGMARLPELMAESGRKTLPAEGVRLAAPIASPGQIVCLGKNYLAHAREFDGQAPERPVLFSKSPASIVGPYDPIYLSSTNGTVDLEAELAVVIGREACRVAATQATDYIAGYTILNDITDRDAQRSDGQWFRAKSFDSFCPIGPWLVTPDEITNPDALQITSKINNTLLQNGNTADMLFKIPQIIAYITETMTLKPGDVIATGTPAGIGSKQTPPVTLHKGDLIEVSIEKLGCQRNIVKCR